MGQVVFSGISHMASGCPFVKDERLRHRAGGGGDLARVGELEIVGPAGCTWRMLSLPPLPHCAHAELLSSSTWLVPVSGSHLVLNALLCCVEVSRAEKCSGYKTEQRAGKIDVASRTT